MLDAPGRKMSGVPLPEKWFSEFGGFWTDRLDAPQELERRLADGKLTEEDADRLTHWMEKGYVVLPGAVPTSVCDDLRQEIERAWSVGDERLRVFPPGSRDPVRISPDLPSDRLRIVDIYVFVEAARQALFSPPIAHFLELVFERPPLLFQGLSFERGSQQGMHQDTAYVVTSSPLELAACWIALQDVVEGSGELMYYEGSHRLPEYRFSGAHRHWKPERDGAEQHKEWATLLNANAQSLGMPKRTFLPRKGDALIWAADLAHGGSPVTDPEATRKSLVGHYCPVGVEPNYFGYRPDRRGMKPYATGFYCSEHFDVLEVEGTVPAPSARTRSRSAPGMFGSDGGPSARRTPMTLPADDAVVPDDTRPRAWRDGPGWFDEHFRDAAGQVVDFFAADGVDLAGKRVADLGCGEGLIDLGVFTAAALAEVVGYDLLPVDRDHLARLSAAHGGPTPLPEGLRFERCSPTTLPVDDASFDHVFSWSAFEHVLDPVTVLREVRRILRPQGLLMVQIWPLFHSEHGSHLWEWDAHGFAHLRDSGLRVTEEQVRADLADDPAWAEARIEEARTLNRITLDELNRALLAAGFYVSKLELLTEAVHLPRELARYPLASLGIAGVKLLASQL